MPPEDEKVQEEGLIYPWVYRTMNSGYEIMYVKDCRLYYFMEGDDDTVIIDNEEIVKYIVELHNNALETRSEG